MDPTPLVSVIVPCYNSERYLAETLRSVLSQSYTNLEVIAADDGSTDGTVALLEKTAASDARLRVVRRTTRGGRPAITKNTALEHVRGRYVAFLDHDDLYRPGKIERQVCFLQSNPTCVAVFHDIEFVDAAGQAQGRYLPDFLTDAKRHLRPVATDEYVCDASFFKFQSLRYAAMHTISVMVSLAHFPLADLRFDTQYLVCDDTDLWIRLGLAGEVGYVDEVRAQYRLHDTNITRNRLKLDLDAVALLQNNYRRIAGQLDSAEQQALRARTADVWSAVGWTLRCQGRRGQAAAAYLKALRRDPKPAYAWALAKSWLPRRDAGK